MMLGCTQFSWSETRDSSVALDLFVAEVEAMVNFCQSGVLPDSIELISQLSIIADRFLMPSLSGLCQQELSRILVHERCPKSAVKVGCPKFFTFKILENLKNMDSLIKGISLLTYIQLELFGAKVCSHYI